MSDLIKDEAITDKNEYAMKCNTCGQEFDPGNLTSVMVHEHNEDINPALAIGIKGERIPKTLLEIQNEVDNTQKTTVTLNNEKAI